MKPNKKAKVIKIVQDMAALDLEQQEMLRNLLAIAGDSSLSINQKAELMKRVVEQ